MSYDFFQNKDCKYYPCHKGIDKEKFNCMFCYCPLYALKEKCGGHFVFTDNGIKDCSGCNIPHNRDNYEYMVEKAKLLIEFVRKTKDE